MDSDILRSRLRTAPFKPFRVVTADGQMFNIQHHDFVFLTRSGRTLMINTEGDIVHELNVSSITRMEFSEEPENVE